MVLTAGSMFQGYLTLVPGIHIFRDGMGPFKSIIFRDGMGPFKSVILKYLLL